MTYMVSSGALNSTHSHFCRAKERERDADVEDEEEAYERKKMERRLREKEAAYQEVR